MSSLDLKGADKDFPVALKLSDRVRAGQTADTPIVKGETVKIMTGAPVPSGADAVVMRECVLEQGDTVKVLV